MLFIKVLLYCHQKFSVTFELVCRPSCLGISDAASITCYHVSSYYWSSQNLRVHLCIFPWYFQSQHYLFNKSSWSFFGTSLAWDTGISYFHHTWCSFWIFFWSYRLGLLILVYHNIYWICFFGFSDRRKTSAIGTRVLSSYLHYLWGSLQTLLSLLPSVWKSVLPFY